MASKDIVKQTVIMFYEDEDTASVMTANRRWINKMVKLEEQGHAEEVEAALDGHREFEMDKSLIKIPFYRKPRVYTKAQREEARERLAKVREAVHGKPTKKKPVRKKKPAPPPVEEEELEEELEEIEELEDEDLEEEEEVVVRKPTRKSTRKRRK